MSHRPNEPQGKTKTSEPPPTEPDGIARINHLHQLAVRSLNPVLALYYLSFCFDGLQHARDQLVKLEETVAELPELPLSDDPFSGDHVIKLAGVIGTSAHAAAFALAIRTWDTVQLTALVPDNVTDHRDEKGNTFSRVTQAVSRCAPTQVEWTLEVWKGIRERLSNFPAPEKDIWENALALERNRAARGLEARDQGENHSQPKAANPTRNEETSKELATNWAENPLRIFEELKNHVLEALDIVINAHQLAVGAMHQTPLDQVAGEYSDPLLRAIGKAQSLWHGTRIQNYLVRSEGPVHLDTMPSNGQRVSGSCYHDLALGLAVGLYKGIREKLPASEYVAYMRSHAAVGDGVAQRLATIRSEISCEWQRGIERWKEAHGKAANPETSGEIDGIPGQETLLTVDKAKEVTDTQSKDTPPKVDQAPAPEIPVIPPPAKKLYQFGIELTETERIAQRGNCKADFGGNERAWELFKLILQNHPARIDPDSLAKRLANPPLEQENVYRIVSQVKSQIKPLGLALKSKKKLGWLLTDSPDPRAHSKSPTA